MLWQPLSTLAEACGEPAADRPADISSIPNSPKMNRFCHHKLQFQATASFKNVTDERLAERELLNFINLIATHD